MKFMQNVERLATLFRLSFHLEQDLILVLG